MEHVVRLHKVIECWNMLGYINVLSGESCNYVT